MIYLNGRYLTAEPTGVQRVAASLIGELDRPGTASSAGWGLLRPRGSRDPQLQHIRDEVLGSRQGQAWEQIELARKVRGSVLVSLCNTAPLLHDENVVMVHDAQVYSSPTSYSAAFRAWYRILLPTLGRRALKILTVSEYSSRQLVHYGVSTPEKMIVVPNGADHLTRVPPDYSVVERFGLNGRPYVLALSSLQSHKNIKVLFEAFRRPELAGVHLILAGRAEGAAFLRAGLEPSSTVTFTGAIDDAELSGLMRRAAATAVPSLTEGFGLVPLEAMSVGCPAVVSPCGALPEACGDAAIYADPDSPEQWAGALAELANSEQLRAARRAAGSARAALFTWSKSAQRLAVAAADAAAST